MNWLIRLGQWFERRRVVRWPDLEEQTESFRRLIVSSHDVLDKKITELMINQPAIPQQVAKEIALINIRLDKLELYVGLKREQAPVQVPDTARIQ